MTCPSRLPILLIALTPLAASAHPFGAHGATLFDGILHPITGLDHFLAMIAVGLGAARMRERRWVAIACSMASMLGGLALSALGIVVPFTEWAIVGSVMLFGLIVTKRGELPVTALALTFSVFALFHGMAHGQEANGGVGLAYVGGMLLTTGALHALGFGVARRIADRWGTGRARWTGVPIALSGLALLVGG